MFRNFPTGCCGDTCYLLAEFLIEHGIETYCVSGEAYPQTHAWLILSDDFVTKRIEHYRREKEEFQSFFLQNHQEDSNAYLSLLNMIKTNKHSIPQCPIPSYDRDSEFHTVIDITGDQFKNEEKFLYYNRSVYIGRMDELHRLFEIERISKCNGIRGIDSSQQARVIKLYETIIKYI